MSNLRFDPERAGSCSLSTIPARGGARPGEIPAPVLDRRRRLQSELGCPSD